MYFDVDEDKGPTGEYKRDGVQRMSWGKFVSLNLGVLGLLSCRKLTFLFGIERILLISCISIKDGE